MKAKKILCSTLAASFAIGAISISAFAETEKTMSVTLRIEGINQNLYYDTVDVPYISDNLTVQNALKYIDDQNDSIAITDLDSGWITTVNDDTQGAFGGWDGWLYTVNGISPSDTIDGYNLSDGDNIVLYYGDPYGVGMQYPVADESRISEGILTFKSEDTTYDADYNPSVSVNPVSGATVTWNCDGDFVEYVTDENGSIKIDSKYLTEGSHSVAINKVSDNGIPLVLRLSPDYSVYVNEAQSSDESTSKSESDKPVSEPGESSDNASNDEKSKQTVESKVTHNNSNNNSISDGKAPATGDASDFVIAAVFAGSLIIAAAFVLGKKKNEE